VKDGDGRHATERPGDAGVLLELEDGEDPWLRRDFGRVLDAFVASFVDRHDLGAACTTPGASGRPRGLADHRTRRPRNRDTAADVLVLEESSRSAYLLVKKAELARPPAAGRRSAAAAGDALPGGEREPACRTR
jgi:hypothetical protein